MNKKTRTKLGNIIYQAVIGYCERLEHEEHYIGNSHHLAQKITSLTLDEFDKADILCVEDFNALVENILGKIVAVVVEKREK